MPLFDEKCLIFAGKRIKLNVKEEKKSDVTKRDLELLIDLFFLPYEHGEQAKHLIAEFKWLQANALPIDTLDKKSKLVSLFKCFLKE